MTQDELATAIHSTVKVLAVSNMPDYEQPWERRGPAPSTGSGVIIATPRGPRVLTNAHCTENAVFLAVARLVARHADAAAIDQAEALLIAIEARISTHLRDGGVCGRAGASRDRRLKAACGRRLP